MPVSYKNVIYINLIFITDDNRYVIDSIYCVPVTMICFDIISKTIDRIIFEIRTGHF